MNTKFAQVCMLAAMAAFTSGAIANEAAVRQALQGKLKLKVETVRETPFGGIYEAIIETPQGLQAFYTDAKLTYILRGELIDLRGQEPRSLTDEAIGKIASGLLAKSTEQAVKRVKGNGKRVLYTFEDPNCGYCKELQKELVKLNDVTIYTFLWPILNQDSHEKSKAIWCAKDRAKAWDDYMLRGAALSGRRDCDASALERNRKLAQRFGLRGTPAVYTAGGEQVGGFVPAEKLEAALRNQ